MVNSSTTVHVEVLVATGNIALPRDEGTQQVHNMKNEVARNNSLTVIVCYYVTLSTRGGSRGGVLGSGDPPSTIH